MNLKSFYTHKGFDTIIFFWANDRLYVGVQSCRSIFYIGQLLAQEKTAKFFFTKNQIP